MPIVLVFDTETTGLPERNASIMDVEKWPYILQLSYILYDTETKNLLELFDNLIKIPPSVIITPGSEAIHHITHDMCLDKGIFIIDALTAFNNALDRADVVVGHNISFDMEMLKKDFEKEGIHDNIDFIPTVCTQRLGCKYLGMKEDGRLSLESLHRKLFGIGVAGAHGALDDVNATARCFMKIEQISQGVR